MNGSLITPILRPEKETLMSTDLKNIDRMRRRGIKPYKSPGADHRKHYRITLLLSTVSSLLVVITAFRAPIGPPNDAGDFRLSEQVFVQMEDIQQSEQRKRLPPPPRPPVPVEVPNDTILDDVALDLDVSLDLEAVATALPPPPSAPAEQTPVEEEEEIFVVVEQMPRIIGGVAEVYRHLVYPSLARQAGLEGLCVVQLVVSKDGTPRSMTIARSAGEVLDVAAMAALSKVQFEPGRQRGKAVPVRMAIPIRFRLKDRSAI
ncbi:energy transducer TonB [Rhodothermus sp. AH-315-K08]|nr:energy transducer TonB [Rhodothermus sp. AH-315-K08]